MTGWIMAACLTGATAVGPMAERSIDPRLDVRAATRAVVTEGSLASNSRVSRDQAGTILLGAMRPRLTDRRKRWTALGAMVGLFAVGYVGAKIEGDRCLCDDPGLQGFLIGAPIGAVAGGIIAWKLAGR